MNPIRVALAVARKDLRSEWRTRELVPALAQFIILALLIGNFGFQIDSRNAATIAPGILWLALVFAGLVAFGYLLHRTVPLAMDSTRFSRCPNYFFLCFTFIINIHHYFLDRANWRLSDPETRRVLLGVAPDRVAEPEFSSGATSPI